jgi:ABC-type glutathione transport system ATPase component
MNNFAPKQSGVQLAGKHEAAGYLADNIKDRRSQELIFALVGPVGSGCTTVANELLKLENTSERYLHEQLRTKAKWRAVSGQARSGRISGG